MKLCTFLQSIGLCMLVTVPQAHAQETKKEYQPEDSAAVPAAKAESALEEIIVTARRTKESLQEVPIAISVLDSDALAEKQISSLEELGAAVPGLSMMTNNTFGGPDTASFSMRGQAAGYASSAPGVLAYMAEVPNFSSLFYDIANVQVLKGPQGTLFGRNTTGGAVLFTPTKPRSTGDFTGEVKTTIGNYGRRNLEFAADVPMSWVGDWLSMRIAGQRLHRDGYTINRLNGDDLDDEGRQSYRISLVASPFDGFENYTVFQHDRFNEHGASAVLHAFRDSPGQPYLAELGPYLAEQNSRGPRVIESDSPAILKQKSSGIINTTTWNVNEQWTLKNIFSRKVTKADRTLVFDGDGSSFRLSNGSQTPPNTGSYANTEEFQVQFTNNLFHAVTGVYYERSDRQPFVNNSLNTLNSGFGLIPITFAIDSGDGQRSRAAFAQASTGKGLGDLVDIFRDLTLTAGLRRTIDDTYFHGLVGTLFSPFAPGGTIVNSQEPDSITQSAKTWELGAAYQFTPDVMGYLSVRRGYRKGGFNVNVPAGVDRTFEPEYLMDHEVGMKSQWTIGDWRIRLNSDFFYDTYKNIQRNVFLPGAGVPTQIVRNAAAAKIWGFEFDSLLSWGSWDVPIQYTYLKGSYDSFIDPVYGDLSQSDFPNTPKHQVSVSPTLHWDLPDNGGRMSATVSYYWQSVVAFDPVNKSNGNPLTDAVVKGSVGEAYHRIDLRVALDKALGTGLGFAAFARNITDETYPVGGINLLGLDLIGVAAYRYALPRMYGIEVSYEF